ncbi:MAG: CinA family protein [Betaproteobacteria bacterium]|nr:CinA family protein [Betaproteobacteria bacterium]
MPSDTLTTLATLVGARLKERGLMLATAESCTGGWVAQSLTSVSGSSDWFERGFVTYSNSAKAAMRGVAPETLAGHGAVSEQTAREMASGALARSRADLALAITGVAGPTGGSADKPVGMVCFAWARKGAPITCSTRRFSGDREAVRRQSVIAALQGVLELLES